MQNLKQLIKEFRESLECDELPEFEAKCGSDLPKLLDAVEILVEGLEFYADGAGLELVDEGRDYLSNYVAYENDFRRDTPNHLDKPVGEYAKQALQLAEEKVRL